MILKETIDAVCELPIEEVIPRYNVELKRAGANWKGLSPWTDERTPSLMVSPAKRIFKDFSSGRGGNVINFVMEKEFMTYPEAIRDIASKFGIEVLESQTNEEDILLERQREACFIIHEIANKYWRDNYAFFPEVQQYVSGRGISPQMVEKFQIGVAPATLAGLTNHLINLGYDWQMCVHTSVLGYSQEKNTIYDRFRARLMFPIRSLTGTILGFGGRDLTGDKNKAKYLNSSESVVYEKSKILYGLYEGKHAIAQKQKVYLVEGYTDVISFHQAGIENIVSSSGTSLTIEQAKLIKRFCKYVVVMFDADSAGIRAALRGIDILLAEGLNVSIVLLPAGQDPDDFAKSRNEDQIMTYLIANSKDFLIFKLNYLLAQAEEDLSKKSDAITDVVVSISKIPNPVQREVYLRECSKITALGIDSLRQMLQSVTSDQENFEQVETEFFDPDYSKTNRMFLFEQCEKKIIQYVLAYGDMVFDFKEIMVDLETFAESVEVKKRTIIDKIQTELESEGFQFLTPEYAYIFEKAKLADLSAFGWIETELPPEQFLMAQQLRGEELAMNRNAFTDPEKVGHDIVKKQLEDALHKSVEGTILFYKSLHLEKMIDDEVLKENPDMESLALILELLVKIKRELNFV